jgi:flagellar hook-associated protein 3 FlgL
MSSIIDQQLAVVTDRLSRLQREISSGIRIQRPSDDPAGAVRATNLKTGIALVNQYRSAVDDSTLWLKTEDSALGSIIDLTRQVREAGLRGANPQPDGTREALGKQIEALRTSLMQVANTSDGLRYIFAGHKTMTVPFEVNAGAVTYAGDDNVKHISIGAGVTLELNHSGADVFNMGGAADATLPDLFATIDALTTAVKTGDQTAATTLVGDLDQHLTRITGIRAETGNRLMLVELSGQQLDESKLVMNELLSNTESTDLAQTLVELKNQEILFQSATFVASTLGQNGVLQWLR